MENYLELLIFLAFAAFSFISRFLNRKKKSSGGETEGYEGVPQPEKPVVDPERPESQPPPVSFEEILREMMGETKRKPKPQPEPPGDVKRPASRAKEKTNQDRQTAQKAQRGVAQRGASTVGTARRITDKISLEDSGKRIETVDVSQKKNTVAKEVAEALSNPRSAREAIILSEIINRKYM
ncbi:MAG: hypothetical protein AAF944_08760 [Bacteroidota bacterium]